MKTTFFRGAALFAIAAVLMITAGCGEKKTETPKTESTETAQQQPPAATTPPPATTPAPETPPPAEKPAVTVPDITGTWTGTLDKRSTRLTITKQDSLRFEGSISINYREAINQKVSGTFDPAKKTLRMKDLLHSRYQGTYAAPLNDDLTAMSGSFPMTAEKTRSAFSLKKK